MDSITECDAVFYHLSLCGEVQAAILDAVDGESRCQRPSDVQTPQQQQAKQSIRILEGVRLTSAVIGKSSLYRFNFSTYSANSYKASKYACKAQCLD